LVFHPSTNTCFGFLYNFGMKYFSF